MRIKELRIEENLTQIDLANAIKTSQRNIGRWENEENEPTVSSLIALANYFHCSIDYLVSRSDDFGNVNVSTLTGEQLTKEEKSLLANYRKLNKLNRMHVDTYVLVRLENQQDEQNKKA